MLLMLVGCVVLVSPFAADAADARRGAGKPLSLLLILAGCVVLRIPLQLMLLMLAGWVALLSPSAADADHARQLGGTGKPPCG